MSQPKQSPSSSGNTTAEPPADSQLTFINHTSPPRPRIRKKRLDQSNKARTEPQGVPTRTALTAPDSGKNSRAESHISSPTKSLPHRYTVPYYIPPFGMLPYGMPAIRTEHSFTAPTHRSPHGSSSQPLYPPPPGYLHYSSYAYPQGTYPYIPTPYVQPPYGVPLSYHPPYVPTTYPPLAYGHNPAYYGAMRPETLVCVCVSG
jgi:hypothetical protein